MVTSTEKCITKRCPLTKYQGLQSQGNPFPWPILRSTTLNPLVASPTTPDKQCKIESPNLVISQQSSCNPIHQSKTHASTSAIAHPTYSTVLTVSTGHPGPLHVNGCEKLVTKSSFVTTKPRIVPQAIRSNVMKIAGWIMTRLNIHRTRKIKKDHKVPYAVCLA